jgi:hypothetical protein
MIGFSSTGLRKKDCYFSMTATVSISTRASLGNRATSMVLRAGVEILNTLHSLLRSRSYLSGTQLF